MNILLINPFSAVAAVRQKNIARALVRRGHHVTLMLPLFDQYSNFSAETIPSQWNVTVIHPKQIYSSIVELSFLLYIPSALVSTIGKPYEIVHAFRPLPFSGFIGYLISRIKKIPFVLEHGDIEWETMENLHTHPTYRVKIVKWLERFLTQRADAITVMNSHVQTYVETHYHPAPEVTLVTNGVDTNLFSPGENPSLKKIIQQKINAKKILMFHGKLDNIEHIKDLVYVLTKIPARYGLVIIGWGKQIEQLQKLAQEQHVEQRIWFCQRQEHESLVLHLQCADILLAPFAKTKGVEHASNLKVFEYMAMAKPIIVSKVGDLPTILKGCASFYEPGNIQQLARAIMSADTNINTTARDESKHHDWSVKAQQFETLYSSLLQAHKK